MIASLRTRRRYIIVIMLITLFAIVSLAAQDAPPADPGQISITGEVETVRINGIVVSGLTVDLSGIEITAALADALVPGATITVTGTLYEGVIIATIITIGDITVETPVPDPESTEEPEVTPEATEEATATPSPESTEEPEVTAVPGVDDDDAIVVIEGPVAAININVITIFNIDIELSPDDPNLAVLQIDDVVRIEGAAHPVNNTIVIVAVNIIIVDIAPFYVINWQTGYPLPPRCKVSKNGKVKCSGKVSLPQSYVLPVNCKVSKNGKLKCSN